VDHIRLSGSANHAAMAHFEKRGIKAQTMDALSEENDCHGGSAQVSLKLALICW